MTPPLKAPLTACLWLTETCNLRCGYCYAAPFSGRVMDTARTLSLIGELGQAGVFDLTLAGGEPLQHPAILEIVSAALDSGTRIGLLSNGVLLTKPVARDLRQRTKGRDFILQISIDSPLPEVNDKARGQTQTVVENIHRAADLGIPMQIACVVHKLNYDTAHLLLDEFYPKIKRFHFLNVQRTVTSLGNAHLLCDESETAQFWTTLKAHAKDFPDDLFLPSLRVIERTRPDLLGDADERFHEQASFDCPSCSAGWTHVDIDAGFDVLGCDIARAYTRMGNLRDRSFAEVWTSPEADAVRAAPYPACYRVNRNGQGALEEALAPEYRALAACMPAASPMNALDGPSHV